MRPNTRTPIELLAIADRVMTMQQPTQQVQTRIDGWPYTFRWDYPGALRVYERTNGTLLVQSLPGQPTKPAPTKRGPRHG